MNTKLANFLLIMFLSAKVFSYEADNFTKRYETLNKSGVESRQILNKKVNEHLQSALRKVNTYASNSCNSEDLYSAVSEQLCDGLFGVMEKYVWQSPEIYKDTGVFKGGYLDILKKNFSSEKINLGIYQAASINSNLKKVGVGPSIVLNGQYVGADKLGHFFDQGKSYADKEKDTSGKKSRKPWNNILSEGKEDLEDGEFGISSVGIGSYADLAANYDGYTFWRQLSSGVKPYFKCSANKWVQVREFDWGDYVTPAWDEAINCNYFADNKFKSDVLKNLKKLELQHKKKFTCPISSEQCTKIVGRYGKVSNFVISPECRIAASSSAFSQQNKSINPSTIAPGSNAR